MSAEQKKQKMESLATGLVTKRTAERKREEEVENVKVQLTSLQNDLTELITRGTFAFIVLEIS